jgi:hypothetical protein
MDLSGVLNTMEEINTTSSHYSKRLLIQSPRSPINLVQQALAWNIISIRIQALVVTIQALIQNMTIRTAFVIHDQLSAVLMHIFMAKDALDTREIGDPAVINRIILLLGVRGKHNMHRQWLARRV